MNDPLENILDAGRSRSEPKSPTALTIAGSDSGGGAGLQADLKTFAACGLHGASVVSLVTAQNTRDVAALQMMPVELVRRQFQSVADDFDLHAAKSGALGNAAMIRTVAELVEDASTGPLVVDPVMISKHEDLLLPEDAHPVLRDTLMGQATVATPNRHEAEALTDQSVTGVNSMKEAAKRIFDFGADHVLVKGSHLEGVVKDILYDGTGFIEYGADRIDTDRLHGSGCVFSSAITAKLAHGEAIPEAIGFARNFITRAIETAPRLGDGFNPVNPLHPYGEDASEA